MLSVVVPVHNEERSVALLYDELRSALEPLDTDWEAVFVDDGSTDGTFAALTRLYAGAVNLRVVRLRRNFGKAAALGAGFDQARGDTVIICRTTRSRSPGCSRSSTRDSISSQGGRRTGGTGSPGASSPGSSTG